MTRKTRQELDTAFDRRKVRPSIFQAFTDLLDSVPTLDEIPEATTPGYRTTTARCIELDPAIAVGDFVYYSAGGTLPATALEDQTTEAANQEAFHDSFLGVALESFDDGPDASIEVQTAGTITVACISTTYQVGELVGLAEYTSGEFSGTKLEPQKVKKVATPNLAVGRVARWHSASAITEVEIEIVSTLMFGGPQQVA